MEENRKLVIVIIVSLVIGLLIGYATKGKKKEKKPELKQLLQTALQEVEKIENENKELSAIVKKAEGESREDQKIIDENLAVKQQLDNAHAERKKMEGMVAQLKASGDEYTARISALENENQSLKTQMQKVQGEKTGAEDEIAQLKIALSEAEDRIAQAEEAEGIDTEGKEAEYKELIGEYESSMAALKEENQSLRTQIETVTREKDKAESLVAQLNATLSEAGEKAKAVEELRVLSDDLKTRVSELEKENKELKTLVETIRDMMKDKETPGNI